MRTSLLVCLAIASASCGGDDRRPAGSPCVDGSNCQKGLVCFINTDDPTAGVCTEPTACNGDLDCFCVEEIAAVCTTGTSCNGRDNDFTLSCNRQPSRQEGESCSLGVDCVVGLFCWLEERGELGTCTPLPTACGTSPDCQCFASVCEVQSCSVSYPGISTIECR